MTNQSDIAEYALRLGDDALVHGQRLCEWCADAPFLEEDIAIANAGLDYLGRARMLLQYAGSILGRSEDELAFLRDAPEFRNLLILELPRGDFAFATVRQYLLDEYAVVVVPGAPFGAPEHFRLSYATDMETLDRGLTRMAEAFERLV